MITNTYRFWNRVCNEASKSRNTTFCGMSFEFSLAWAREEEKRNVRKLASKFLHEHERHSIKEKLCYDLFLFNPLGYLNAEHQPYNTIHDREIRTEFMFWCLEYIRKKNSQRFKFFIIGLAIFIIAVIFIINYYVYLSK